MYGPISYFYLLFWHRPPLYEVSVEIGESTPANLLNFNFSLDIFVLFCFVSFWHRQEKGREVRKREENGWGERWGEPKSNMSLDYGIHTAPLLYSLVNFSGLESLSWALCYPCHCLGKIPQIHKLFYRQTGKGKQTREENPQRSSRVPPTPVYDV